MARKTTAHSERHTKFVDLLEFGGLRTPKIPPATGLSDSHKHCFVDALSGC